MNIFIVDLEREINKLLKKYKKGFPIGRDYAECQICEKILHVTSLKTSITFLFHNHNNIMKYKQKNITIICNKCSGDNKKIIRFPQSNIARILFSTESEYYDTPPKEMELI